ncbi:hypothetical protein B0O99DRAFT_692088 [Bisporella sp. PMI_857]|nr:hypothetical protein B0O99DRAFT_692088 [Bisporella sp. PMI_857]
MIPQPPGPLKEKSSQQRSLAPISPLLHTPIQILARAPPPANRLLPACKNASLKVTFILCRPPPVAVPSTIPSATVTEAPRELSGPKDDPRSIAVALRLPSQLPNPSSSQVNLNATLVAQEVAILAGGSAWQDQTVRRLVQARLQMQLLNDGIHANIDAMKIRTSTSATEESDWESEDWRNLQSTIKAVQRRIDLIYQSYTQIASIHESKITNQQAQGVIYLTSVATVFVPTPLIAGIFSIGGKFAVGASMFWVFWAVSIPFIEKGENNSGQVREMRGSE